MVKTVESTLASINPEEGTRASLTDTSMKEVSVPSTTKGESSGALVEASVGAEEILASSSGIDTGAVLMQEFQVEHDEFENIVAEHLRFQLLPSLWFQKWRGRSKMSIANMQRPQRR